MSGGLPNPRPVEGLKLFDPQEESLPRLPELSDSERTKVRDLLEVVRDHDEFNAREEIGKRYIGASSTIEYAPIVKRTVVEACELIAQYPVLESEHRSILRNLSALMDLDAPGYRLPILEGVLYFVKDPNNSYLNLQDKSWGAFIETLLEYSHSAIWASRNYYTMDSASWGGTPKGKPEAQYAMETMSEIARELIVRYKLGASTNPDSRGVSVERLCHKYLEAASQFSDSRKLKIARSIGEE